MNRIRVVLADDHTIVRLGLRAVLERQANLSVIGEASNGREVIEIVEQEVPDIVLMDIAMPLLNGIEAMERITSGWPHTKVIVLSMHSDESYVLRALKAGARGYLLKDSAQSDLLQAIEAVAAGKAFFSPAVSRVLADDYLRQLRQRGVVDPYDLLSPREREVLQLISEGRSSKEIAADLNLSTYTIDTHRSNLMQKLNVHSMPELILYAVRKGIIS